LFKGGTFFNSAGQNYTIYEVDEKNYYRLDICDIGAEFQIEPVKVRYSMVKRRKVWIKGDRELCREFEGVKDTLINTSLPIENSEEWKD
jgi:hypothetical protein